MSYTDPGQHVFWLASRSLGVVALVLIALSVGLGLALSGRISREPGAPARLKHLHEAMALTSLLAIAGHGLLLLGDGYLRPASPGSRSRSRCPTSRSGPASGSSAAGWRRFSG